MRLNAADINGVKRYVGPAPKESDLMVQELVWTPTATLLVVAS
jgi:hypothetical protein